MLLLVLIIFSLKENVDADVITPFFTEKHVLAGDNVTLSCNYSVNVQNLQWYRQYPGSKPEVRLQHPETIPKSEPEHRLFAVADKGVKRMDLSISSTEVSDSALYYCALVPAQNTAKLIFGQGTRLAVLSKEVVEPSIYKVENSCLATDFTRHNALDDKTPFKNQNVTVRYEGHKTYSTFALRTNDNCEESNVCSGELSSGNDEIDIDEKINYMSLGIFWLRILFLKTVVFNVLITVKAWMR